MIERSPLPTFYRTINRSLCEELWSLLCRGMHIALIAPRQSGKALVLYELRRLADDMRGIDRPRVVVLRSFNHSADSNRDFLVYLANALDVGEVRPDQRHSLATQILTVLHAAIAISPSPLWLFVQNIAELPWPCARALLLALNVASEDSDLRQKLSVVVTGGRDFIPLTYDANSPYRHAKQFFLTGLDRELTGICFRTRISGASLVTGFLNDAESSQIELSNEALDYLHGQTGGYVHFIEEVVLSLGRPFPGSRQKATFGAWDLSRVQEIVRRFLDEHMCFDHFCRLSLSDVQSDLEAWQMLEEVVNAGVAKLPPLGKPHLLESTGIVQRVDGETIRFACPIWEQFCRRTLTQQRCGDVYALLGQWDLAWGLYAGTASADCSRPLDGDKRYHLDAVITAWEEHLIEIATNESDDVVSLGADEVVSQFFKGAQHLYGCSTGILFDRSSHRVIDSFRADATTESSVFIKGSLEPVPDAKMTLRLSPRRDCVECEPNVETFLGLSRQAPVLQLQRGDEREIDSSSLSRLKRSLRCFWQSYLTAKRVGYAVDLSRVWRNQLHVAHTLTRLLSNHPGDMRSVVQQTVRKLIDFGHYFRVQICLISASRDRIQAVAGQCENPMLDFTFQTDFPLDPTTPEADWDVQQWVAIKGQAVAIDDASSPFQRSPRTNTEQAAKIQMKGIGVVPLIIKRSGCRPHEILGTIHFERHDRERPTRLEMRYFGILAGQIAVAFDQACRETMLEEALNALPSPFRIVSMDNRVMFRNRAAQTEDHSDQHWSFPIATPPGVVPPGPRFRRSVIDDARSREGDVNHYLTDGGTARDEFAAPIKDWRQNPIGDYYRADPQIGFVHHSFDMTKFQEIHDASQQWLTIRETRETVTRILDYFRTQGFDWCRIYLMEGGVLRSHDEFGLRNKTVRSKFRNGSYSIGLDDHTQQAVCLFEQLKDLAVCEFKPDLEDPPTISRPHGIPTIATRDNWRDHFEKEDDRWLEAPLIVGDAKVGLIAFSIPSSFGPRQYMWLRWCVMNAAIAIQNSQAAERRAKLLEEAAWKAAAQLAIHQLSNKLCNIGPDCTYVQRWLNRPDQITRSGYSLAHDALERTKSAVRKAREILQDFRRYADVKPFRDLRVVTLAELLKTVENNILQYYPELEIEIECSPLQLDIVCSPAAVVEVIEILVENSLLHSHRPRDGLKIEVACCEFDVDANAPEVCIAYSDNGDGIRDQDRPKIFDAFYTTHENGNGLGLPIALTFMQRQGGGIAEIPTPEGQGVLFHLYLPRATTTNIRM